MSRRTRWTTAALVALVAAVVMAGWRADSLAARPDGSRPSEAPTGGVGAPTGPVGTPTSPVEVSPAAPPPRIHPFARQPRRAPHPPLPSPTAPLVIPEGYDGCDHGYGEDRAVCVPWRFPPGVRDRCAWLSAHRYPPLKVVNDRDRHGLDRNRDGTACGRGD
ncbi:hypothetical protein ABNF97_11490 [Plantactinospora sp. B6F1]|uniref:hypothetical protein n=1 Tax=Plantactinospora sp. B6F1 TaxID=3158971 RepID=UPI0032D9A320